MPASGLICKKCRRVNIPDDWKMAFERWAALSEKDKGSSWRAFTPDQRLAFRITRDALGFDEDLEDEKTLELLLVPEEGASLPVFAHLHDLLRERQAQSFLREFQGESDRAAAVLGAAYIDRALEHILRRTLRGGQNLHDALLGTERPLGSLSARIKIAFALGLIAEDSYNDLEIIRKIRNDFAHEAHGFTFQRADVASRCRQLRLPLSLTKGSPGGFETDNPRILFNQSVALLASVWLPFAEAIQLATQERGQQPAG
jgi:mannitol operon repressor